jgi:hypothetical protein
MPTYLFTYRTAKGYTPSDDSGSAWMSWFQQLGSDVVSDIGNPTFTRESVGAPVGETDLGGYSLVTADSLSDAVALTEGCPAVATGGCVEVGEITPLDHEMMSAMSRADGAAA